MHSVEDSVFPLGDIPTAVLLTSDKLPAALDELHCDLQNIKSALDAINAQCNSMPREFLKVEEFAAEVGKAPFTVRGWCRDSRIDATKLSTGEWRIPIQEVTRYQDEGLM